MTDKTPMEDRVLAAFFANPPVPEARLTAMQKGWVRAVLRRQRVKFTALEREYQDTARRHQHAVADAQRFGDEQRELGIYPPEELWGGPERAWNGPNSRYARLLKAGKEEEAFALSHDLAMRNMDLQDQREAAEETAREFAEDLRRLRNRMGVIRRVFQRIAEGGLRGWFWIKDAAERGEREEYDRLRQRYSK